MISDWSGAALEFAFAFEKPILYIDVPKKIHNPDFEENPILPIEVSIRDKIGKIILPSNIDKIPSEVNDLRNQSIEMKKMIKILKNEKIFNIGNSAKVSS